MFRLASLIIRNVLRNRRRTLLTLASTAISLSLLALLMAMYQSFFYGEDNSPAEAMRLVTRHRVSLTQALPASYAAKIRGVPGVVEVSPWSWFQGTYIEPKNFFARFAIDANRIFDIYKDWEIPPDQLKAFKQNRTACAIAEPLARTYKLKLGDRITIVGDIYPVTLELTIAGLFKCAPAQECLVFHQEYLDELLPKDSPARDTIGTCIVLTESPESVPRVSKAIDEMFANSPYPTRSESEKEFGRSFLMFFGNIKLFLAAICAAVTFTILLVSANTIAMAVRERTREMAILRTLGYTPTEILQLVLGESVFITLLGGVIGLAMGYVLGLGLFKVAAGFGFQGLKWQSATIVLSMAILIGLIAAMVPALVAARKNVVESLRFTG
jgi:putative ABC transport system permease protein